MVSIFRNRSQEESHRIALNAALAEAEQLEQELSETRSGWQALLSAVSDPIFTVDGNGLCRPLNHPAERMFPLAEHATLLSMTQSAELDALFQDARTGDDGPHPVTGEITLRYPSERVIQVSVHPIRAIAEQPAPSFFIILRDLTDLRRLETVRRDFVANVSHELRTPLSSVKAMAETLMDGALNDPEVSHHFLETIIRESDRLVRLSADLLDLSRVESRPVTKNLTDLTELVIELAGRMASNARDAGIALTVEAAPPLAAPCDSDEIAQVLVNLLDNAIKYTPNGGTVRVTATNEESQLVFMVEDTGIGILKQDQSRLFERFYRADKARSRASGGTGLGLAIVKHIVERHGGQVWVRSEYNSGSAFYFSLPK